MADNNRMKKINTVPEKWSDIIKNIFLNEYKIEDYSICEIISTTNNTKIKIIVMDDYMFFMVEYDKQIFTLMEYIIFQPEIDNVLFHLYSPPQELKIDDDIIITDPLLVYNNNTIDEK